jgi:hypothetical protein
MGHNPSSANGHISIALANDNILLTSQFRFNKDLQTGDDRPSTGSNVSCLPSSTLKTTHLLACMLFLFCRGFLLIAPSPGGEKNNDAATWRS